jgi:three-Cys-motif partner protein
MWGVMVASLPSQNTERAAVTKRKQQFDEIGYWSEVKLEIIKEYAHAYSVILAKKDFEHFYIDGFAGAGVHLSKSSGDWVPGSPLNALNIQPPFRRHYLVDLDGQRATQLRRLIGDRKDVEVLEGDCSDVLLNKVLPNVRYGMKTDGRFHRALCLLDPYGLHLKWEVMAMAGALKTIDLFLNFPIMDANENVLWSNPARVDPRQAARLTAFWGDESWRTAAYRPSEQTNLFGEIEQRKNPNDAIVRAFRERLRGAGGFAHVIDPMPMRNSTGAVVYYLFFASQQPVADDIVSSIFRKYGDRRS